MVEGKDFVPYVPAEKTIPELTLEAIILGVILTIIFAAANVYLGLYAGMTVCASIPAAVISMGVLKGVLKRGTILENNIAQTVGSAGESLAAGVIFTIPALVIVGAWKDFPYWPIMLVSLLGGLLGISFMIPLRHAFIVEEKELIYPEGVACDKVLEVGDKGGVGVKYVFSALALGALFKFFVSGVKIIKGTVEGAVGAARGVFYFGSDMSVALIGVGYIVGLNIGLLVFIGGAIAWLVGIPIYSYLHASEFVGMAPVDIAWGVWSSQIRYMGVGAMLVGGIWSIISARHGIVTGFKKAISGFKGGEKTEKMKRTDADLPMNYVMLAIIPVVIAIFILYYWVIDTASISLVATIAMIVAGFFFVAVSSYVVGLVGSSNNPVSGMTICTVLFASALLLAFGMTGMVGLIAAMMVAAVVCIASCTAGDISQDLKTGYLVGATPWRQQIGQMIGVAAPGFIMAPVLSLLLKGYGFMSATGTEVVGGPPGQTLAGALKAPQASMFAALTDMMFTGKPLPWNMFFIGAIVAVLIIVVDSILKSKKTSFRMYVMPVAVGIYLPLSLGVPVFVGGIINSIVRRIARKRSATAEEESNHRGVLAASGLIAGEAVMGIGIAAIVAAHIYLPTIIESNIVSLAIIALMIAFLIYVALKGKKA
jgi:putative OPT family oligopeptide transporter